MARYVLVIQLEKMLNIAMDGDPLRAPLREVARARHLIR